MRCFIAVDTVTPRLISIAENVKALLKENRIRASYQNPDTLHITIKFLGEIPAESVDNIIDVLKQINIKKFTIYVNGLGGFPNLRKPRVIFFNIDAPTQLHDLFIFIDKKLAKLGFPRETREFKPHITIARIKSKINLTTKIYEALRSIQIRESIPINCVKLKESILRPSGAIYRDIFIQEI